MSRFKLCPIDLDCLTMTGVKGARCPNREMCNHYAAPVPTITEGVKHSWGYETVVRTIPNDPEVEKGWGRAEPLPYKLIKVDGIPCLMVMRSFAQWGIAWGVAERLPKHYLIWAAGTTGKSLEEAERINDDYFKDPFYQDYFPNAINKP